MQLCRTVPVLRETGGGPECHHQSSRHGGPGGTVVNGERVPDEHSNADAQADYLSAGETGGDEDGFNSQHGFSANDSPSPSQEFKPEHGVGNYRE
jgi:hypothetical protein